MRALKTRRKYLAGDEIIRILRSHHFYWLPKNGVSHGRKMTHWLWFVFVRYIPMYRPTGTISVLNELSAGIHATPASEFVRRIRVE